MLRCLISMAYCLVDPQPRMIRWWNVGTGVLSTTAISIWRWPPGFRRSIFLGCHRFRGGRGRRFRVDNLDPFSLQTLIGAKLFILHNLPGTKTTKALAINTGVVDEDILSIGIDDKSKALLRVKPLHGTLSHVCLLTNTHRCYLGHPGRKFIHPQTVS